MRLNVNINRTQLGEIGYQAAPIRQILKLKLSPSEQLLLLNFFSNVPEWKVSISSISKSFGLKKNRNLVKKELNNLLDRKYLMLDENGYTVNLDKIKSDYLLNLQADNKTTSDSRDTSDNRNISKGDSDPNKGVIVSLSEGDSNINSLIDSNTTTNKINIKEKEINDNQENNPIKENLDLDSNSSIDLGFGFDLENIALKQPKELIDNNYKLVNVNNSCTVVNRDYYDGVLTSHLTTKDSNISKQLMMNYELLKFNEYQLSELDLKYKELIDLFSFMTPRLFEVLIMVLSSLKLKIPNSKENIDQLNEFIIDSIENKNEFYMNLVPICRKFLLERLKEDDENKKNSTKV